MGTIQIPFLTAKIDKYSSLFVRKIFKFRLQFATNQRPSSYPYMSGDSFRALADYIHDETGTFNPENVKKGDIVFVSNPLTKPYLKNIHPLIKQPYILIEHNGDNNIDKDVTDLLDDKIIRFYAQDVTEAHEKVIPIPIAIENLYIYINGITSVLDKLRRQIEKYPPKRKNKVFFFFSLSTNPKERGPAKEQFLKHPCMDTAIGMISPRLHLKTLAMYKFVASPPGNAIESCRTWEALYVKTIPIVKDFVAMKYFASLGLPIWVVHDWKELDTYDEEGFAKKYDELMENANWEPLFMDYWKKRIFEDQKAARSA